MGFVDSELRPFERGITFAFASFPEVATQWHGSCHGPGNMPKVRKINKFLSVASWCLCEVTVNLRQQFAGRSEAAHELVKIIR